MYNQEEERLLQEAIEDSAGKVILERNNREYNILKEQFREQLRVQNSGAVTGTFNKMVRIIESMPDTIPSAIMKRSIDVAGLAATSRAPYLYSHIKRALTAGTNRLIRLGKLDAKCAAVLERAIQSYEQRLNTIKDPEINRGINSMLTNLKNTNSNIQSKIVNSPKSLKENEEYFETEDEKILAETIDNVLSIASSYGIYLDENNNLINENLRSVARQTAGNTSRAIRHAARAVDDTATTIITEKRKRDLLRVRKEVMDGRAPVSRYVKLAIALVAIDAQALPWIGLPMVIGNIIRHRKLKQRERMNLLTELRTEMEIINEKIKDAEADNDRQKKYNYIRLRREIQRGIDQLKYGQRFGIDRAPLRL